MLVKLLKLKIKKILILLFYSTFIFF